MYYGGGWVVGVAWNLINPPKNFKMHIWPEIRWRLSFFSKVIMRFYSFMSLVKLTAGPCRLDLSHSPLLLTYLGRNPIMNVYNTQVTE